MREPSAYIVEDDKEVGELVCQMAEAHGFVTHLFNDPSSFLAQMITPPEVAILDLALGQSDAIELIRQLEALKYTGKILLMSGRGEALLQKANEIGRHRGLAMLPPLEKPFGPSELGCSLNSIAEVRTIVPESCAVPSIFVDVREAIRGQWLEVWYQPKIDLKTLKICGTEALLRARHPRHGLVAPGRFLPDAGDPVYRELTRTVVQQACMDWIKFARTQPKLKIAVNVPWSVMRDPGYLIPLVREILPKDPNFPGMIFEVTEDEAAREMDAAREVAVQLRLYNVMLSVDDFGTGYSSFARLDDLPFVEIKLDRSFVSNCSRDKGKASLCGAGIELGHRLAVTVCAEGVESADDARTLARLGCDTAQGFLFEKPMPAEMFAAKLSAGPNEALRALLQAASDDERPLVRSA